MRTTAETSSSSDAARAGRTSTAMAARAQTRLRRRVRMVSPMTEPGAKQDACYSQVGGPTTAAQLPRTDFGAACFAPKRVNASLHVDLARPGGAECRR